MLDYYQAAVPDGWQILGVKLRPLSLGHLILLKRYGSAFVVGGIPTEADLVLSVLICSRTYEEALELVESGRFKQEAKKLEKALRVCGDVQARCEWFNDYINEGLNISKVLIQLNSVNDSPYQLQYSVTGFGKDSEGAFFPNPLMSKLFVISDDTLTNWTPDAAGSADEYVGGLVLAEIGLERAPVEEAPALEAAPEGD